MGWEDVRERMSVGEPRWENVQARDVAMVGETTCCLIL